MNFINSKFGQISLISDMKCFFKNISFHVKNKTPFEPKQDSYPSDSNIKILSQTQEVDEDGNLCTFEKQLITTPEGEKKITYSYTIR